MNGQINEVKDTILEFIININARIDDISDRYKLEGKLEDERVVNLLDDLQALAEGIDLIKEYYGDIDLNEFREKLDMMASALEDKDVPLFTDIMRYELRDLLEYWKECLNN